MSILTNQYEEFIVEHIRIFGAAGLVNDIFDEDMRPDRAARLITAISHMDVPKEVKTDIVSRGISSESPEIHAAAVSAAEHWGDAYLADILDPFENGTAWSGQRALSVAKAIRLKAQSQG